MTATHGERVALETLFGRLKWAEVTIVGDTERMFLLLTPACPYCGNPNPTGKCVTCGAGQREGFFP